MRAFHHPTAGTIARDELFLAFLFPPTADVRLVVPREQFLVHRSRVVGSIQTQMLWLLRRGLGSADHQTIEGGTEQTDIMAIGSIYDQSQRDPGPIVQKTALPPTFPAIGRVAPRPGPLTRRFY